MGMKIKEQSIMNKFNPIFTATVTPASVKNPLASNGNKYTVMKGASVKLANGNVETRTVMAFGPARDSLSGLLRKGKSIELAVQRDGGSLKVIGLPKAA